MNTTPILQTRRLILRPFSPDDGEALYDLLKDEAVSRFIPIFPPENLQEAKKLLRDRYLKKQGDGYAFAICLKSDDIPMGYVTVSGDESHDLGYALRKDFWGRGIATEACKEVVKLLRESGIPYITATHDINNPKSGEVMKRLGMIYQYSYKERWQPKDILVTFRMYQLTFDGQNNRTFLKYWEQYPVHFVEKIGGQGECFSPVGTNR